MVYHVKGGIWKNTEDEILKAAVMKYGLNQWARISSLLVRKSASQCKSRWYEWLDPSIKKTEWSREEEEKLLHLAKLLPNQWRTIAPIVGRTAHQCLEHYEKLLDMAQQKDGDTMDMDDPRRARPGEIDPNPETKPARPDPIDMDEDEKEMLQEARARLANTKGKKAKRKAREKQLDEARRIAALQKRRELKAAGINISGKRKRKPNEIDYAKEIPFYNEVPAGFFEPEVDKARTSTTFHPIRLNKLEGKKRKDEEQLQRQKDSKKQKQRKETNLPEAIMQANKLNDPQFLRKHSSLQLPNPQMTDLELEELAKLQKNTTQEIDDDEETVTSSLLSDYKQTPTPVRPNQNAALRTPARPDSILAEARNLVALSQTETPLMGGENTMLVDSDFSGATPKPRVAATPNVLATPLRTPRVAGSSLTTPVRDQLHINADLDAVTSQSKQKMKSIFSSLPKPKNTYNVVLPDLPDDDESAQAAIIEDQRDIEARKQQQEEEKKQRIFQQRSTVLQRQLPRSTLIPKQIVGRSVQDLINQEVRTIILHDQVHFPIKSLAKSMPTKDKLPVFDIFEDNLLNQSKQLIEEEYRSMLRESQIDEEQLLQAFPAAWEKVHSFDSFTFSKATNQYVTVDSLSQAEQIQSLEAQFEMLRSKMTREANRSKKLEQKLVLYNAGYEQNSHTVQRDIGQLFVDIELAETELVCFQQLKEKEKYSIQQRIAQAEANVKVQQERESLLQSRYLSLQKQLKALNAQ